MKFRSSLADGPDTEPAPLVPQNRQRPYRHTLRNLCHVSLDATNGAVLRDLSEFGIALQTINPLTPHQQVQLRFELPAPRVRIETAGRVVWTDSWGQAGVQFRDLPHRFERLLKEWIFTQILSSAYLFCPCESGPVEGSPAAAGTQLLFSASPRPSIQLKPPAMGSSALPLPQPRALRFQLLWHAVSISQRMLASLLDGLVLLCAVLLFAVMSLLMTSVLPAWPVTIILLIGIASAILVLYWLLFAFWIGVTPGGHLAGLACSESGNEGSSDEELEARFR